MANGQARLWHLPTSHYSEKVRWALDHKRIAYTKHLPRAVPHFVVARLLTGGETGTFPILQIDGDTIGDSTRIIAELERRHPDPPLYPEDPADRERALAIEDWYDENLGSDIRIIALHGVTHDPDRLRELSGRHIPLNFRPFPGAWARIFARTVTQRYGLDRPGRLEAAREGVARAFDRLEAELGGGDYLVGDAFTVADLAVASHFYWLAQPEEGPHIVSRLPREMAELMEDHVDRDGYRWVLETYRRHRRPAATDPRGTPRPLASARG
jgi:glutathione S-transferase